MVTPKWSLAVDEYCERLGIHQISELESFAWVPEIKSVSRIVPLRFMKRATALFPMRRATLNALIKKVPTQDGNLPFVDAEVDFRKIDSQQLFVGQRFAYRDKYLSIIEDMPHLFEDYLMPHGIVDLGAQFVLGEDKAGEAALACYLPPLVERHGAHLVIMDGIHRNWIAKQVGATISAIVVERVKVPFPCEPHPWQELALAVQKPEKIEDRFFGLHKELFRDLKYLGIDG